MHPGSATADSKPLQGKRVLLVEDEALIAFEAEEVLLDLGASDVLICGTYSKAADVVERDRPDLGVFDLDLRGRHSAPLVRRFIELGGNAIVATGHEVDEEIEDLPIEHLRKPYNRASIVQALRKLGIG